MSPKWIAVIGCTVIVLLLLGFATFLIAMPSINERALRAKSKDNLRTLLTLAMSERDGAPALDLPTLHGRSWILALVATGRLDSRNATHLVCLFSTTQDGEIDPAEYQALTLERLQTERFPHLTGYAGPGEREPGWKGARPLIGDLTFEDGAIIGFSDGTVRWVERDELGLGDDDPIQAGPASKSPLLRMLSDE